ncbi:MAG TPA: zinc ribbon domain-containing protein [Clostridiaceae bacterium]|nr:zinc ribbon domain-containing protein [Clostridiaceae bacterium]
MKYYMIILLALLVILQAAWIFTDAKRRYERYYWLWGLFGLLNVPSSLIIYLIVTRHGNTTCGKCGASVPNSFKYCPNCGSSLKKLVCPNCGMPVNRKWIYCPNCSKKLKEG